MNAEIAGRSESGQKSLIGPSKKFRSRAGFPKMLAAFFCAFSVMSYTAIVYTAAEKAVHGAYAEHMISGILRKSDPGDAISGDGDEEINGNFVLNGSTDDRESDPKNEEAPAEPPAGVGAASATHPIKTEDMSCENIFALSNQTGYSPTPKHFSLHA